MCPACGKPRLGFHASCWNLTGSVRMLTGVMRNMGQAGLITEPAATLLAEDLGPPRVREPLLRLRDSGCLVLRLGSPGGQAFAPDRALQKPGQFCKTRDLDASL